MDISEGQVLVVWLDEIRWFLEDMNLTDSIFVPLGRKRRRLPNFASALKYLLSVALAKEQDAFGGFQEKMTGEEQIPTCLADGDDVRLLLDGAWSPEILGYLQPPVVVVLPGPAAPHQELLSSLGKLCFHCGGRIYVFAADAPPRCEPFRLDGSCGWSKSCKHVDRCQCPRTPVSPYGSWGWHLWRSFHDQLPQAWHLRTLDHWPAVAQSVTVVVFHFVQGKVKVLQFWRDATAGGHFTAWSVPGGSILTGKDLDLWSTARREWDEEMIGYPWDLAVGSDALEGESWSECIQGSQVYRRGSCLLCVASLGEVFLAHDQWSEKVFSQGWSPRSNATLYAPASPDFYGTGKPLPLVWPERCVTPATLRQSRRKIHTEGWPFMEHSGEARWKDWNVEEAGAGVFPTMQSRNLVLPILRSVYGWA